MRLRSLRKEKGMTMKQLGDYVGASESAISLYETGKREADYETLLKFAELFDCSIDYLFERTENPVAIIPPKGIRIPVYGVIPAGTPIDAVEDILDYEEIPADWTAGGKEYFALKLRGNSMIPDYIDGDVVIFQKADTCENGEECAVMVSGEEATFKKVIRQKGGVLLQPLNVSEYEPKYYTNKEIEELPVRVIGVARELRRKI